MIKKADYNLYYKLVGAALLKEEKEKLKDKKLF